jgi:hypothetical protein
VCLNSSGDRPAMPVRRQLFDHYRSVRFPGVLAPTGGSEMLNIEF